MYIIFDKTQLYLVFYRKSSTMDGEETFNPVYQGEETTVEDDLRMSDDGDEMAVVKVRGWTTDDMGAFICQVPVCEEKRFKTTYTFSRHWMEKHVTPIKQFLCPEPNCEKKNIHATDLKKHVKDKHNQVLPRDYKFKWRKITNDRYLSPGSRFFGPNERKFPVQPKSCKNKAVIVPVNSKDIPMNASTTKRKFQKIPKSVEIIEDDFSSDDESETPAKRVKSKVVVVPQKKKSTDESNTGQRQISLSSEQQPEITITIQDDVNEENSGSLSDDNIDQIIEQQMREDGELESKELPVKDNNDKETEKEDIESLCEDGGEKSLTDESDSESESSSGSEGEDSGSEDEADKPVQKSSDFKVIPLEPGTGDLPGQSIVEIEKKLKEARCNRRRFLKEEARWADELAKREKYTWQNRYTKAVTALEEEREVRRKLEKQLEKTIQESQASKVEELEKEVKDKEAALQDTRSQLMSLASKYELSENEVKTLKMNLTETEKKLNSPRLTKCMEFMKLMCSSSDKSEQ